MQRAEPSLDSMQLFDELKEPGAKMQNGKDFPPLFDFTKEGMSGHVFAVPRLMADESSCAELSIRPDLNSKLVPQHAEEALLQRGIDIHNFSPIPAEEMRITLD